MILAEPIFLSLQWEWPNTWKPSIFIRFYGCNLCCKRCDSLYAVNNPESIIDITTEEVVKEIKKLNCHNIVFTGWEPTLFNKHIDEIQKKLWNWYTYEVETNGSTPVRNIFATTAIRYIMYISVGPIPNALESKTLLDESKHAEPIVIII